MGHILSLFAYLLTTSVSGRVPVVLPDYQLLNCPNGPSLLIENV